MLARSVRYGGRVRLPQSATSRTSPLRGGRNLSSGYVTGIASAPSELRVGFTGCSSDSRKYFSTEAESTKAAKKKEPEDPNERMTDRYKRWVADGTINADPRQELLVHELQDLCDRCQHYNPPVPDAEPVAEEAPPPKKESGGGLFGGLFGGSSGSAKPAQAAAVAKPKVVTNAPQGLYVWGGTGCGKTFMMDLFYERVPIERKERVHFHEWMIGVHDKLHAKRLQNEQFKKADSVWTAEGAKAQRESLKQAGGGKVASADDLVAQVAAEMMQKAWLICFDEFQVTHISDAIILKRLFSCLFDLGAVVIATSNRPPEDLYLHGLNRNLFLPFIPMLESTCKVLDMDSEMDYRLIAGHDDDDDRVFIYPLNKEHDDLLYRKFVRMSQQVETGVRLTVQARQINVRKASRNGVAWFHFADLCDKPLGPPDYLGIAAAYHTVFVESVPKLTLQERDQVRRFISMIDVFYDRGLKVLLTADADIMHLFTVTDDERKNSNFDEIFAWDRTVSRLTEMQSSEYLTKVLRQLTPEDFVATRLAHEDFTQEDLSQWWNRYDTDGNKDLDREEMRKMLEDILEATMGHRNLSDEVLDMVFSDMDEDGNGTIDKSEFTHYIENHGLLSPAEQWYHVGEGLKRQLTEPIA